MMNRRTFFMSATAGVQAAILGKQAWAGDAQPKAAIASDLVERFVGKSHRDFDAVQEMLDREPQLVNACWDWGQGDFETGLGAATHTGRRSIAELILDRGGRIDLFAATMLGLTKIVHAAVEAMPDIHAVPGPHAIPLLSHAVVGREAAFELVGYLLDRGAAINAQSRVGVSPLIMAASIGHVEAVKLLLSRGADATLTDREGRTALDRARERQHQAVVALLTS